MDQGSVNMKVRKIVAAGIGVSALLGTALAFMPGALAATRKTSGAAASVSAGTLRAPRAPHVIGTWPNDVSMSNAGGYLVWSNGHVQALGRAPYYGSANVPANNVVGFASDGLSDGYWLITSTGHHYSIGTTCEFETLVGPKNPPRSGVVGAVNLSGDDEGFNMVTSNGHLFPYRCQFSS
jgi:hypothetical protein